MGQGKSQIAIKKGVCLFYFLLPFALQVRRNWEEAQYPSITDGVHRNENFVEIIPVFSTFSKKIAVK